MRPSLTLMLLLLCVTAKAQQFKYELARSLFNIDIRTIATDSKGNLYTTGLFAGTPDFDPGPGIANALVATPSGYSDHYFARYDAKGNYVYAKGFGDDVSITGIATDINSGIYVAGYLGSKADLDPGPGTAAFTAKYVDPFLAKYDDAGNYVYGFTLPSQTSAYAYAVTVDTKGDVWIAGQFQSTIDMDPDPVAQYLLTPTGPSNNLYLARYSPAGKLLQAKALYSVISSPPTMRLATDSAGNLFLSIAVAGTVDLDPGPGTVIYQSKYCDHLLAKYDAAGNYLWGGSLQGKNANYGEFTRMNVDNGGNVYVTGQFADSVDADLGAGTSMLYSKNLPDVYVCKYDPAGKLAYARTFQSDALHHATGIITNRQGDILISGLYTGMLQLSPGNSAANTNLTGLRDGYVAGMDPGGRYTGSMSIGGPLAYTAITSIAPGKDGRFWATGHLTNIADLDPGADTAMLNGYSGNTCFFASYSFTNTTGIHDVPTTAAPVKIFSAHHAIIIDMTAQQQVHANIRVVDMTGRTITTANHDRNDMLRLQLPDAAPQVYAVIVENAGAVTTKKLWVE